MTLPPIAVLSFKRPDYLKQVLESLKAQTVGSLEDRGIHLFQDGAVNRYSRIRYARDEDIAASVEVFRSIFPEGQVHASPDNIGVCENYRRAEQTLFEDLDADIGYFFEDDLVLSPVYLEMMDRLADWASRMPNVAYFAAYGDYYASAEDREARKAELTTLDHHWGFGLLRRHWRQINALLGPYYEIVCGEDYSRRDHRRIYDLYRPYKASPRASSQDAAKAFACDRLGLWRANTVVSYAKYIGDSGQHMTRNAYEALGYDKVVVAQFAEPLRFPKGKEIDAGLREQRAIYEYVYSKELSQLVNAAPARKYNPFRLCDENDVVYAYKLLLGRHASEEQRQLNAGRLSVHQLVSSIMTEETRSQVPWSTPPRSCTREDLTYIYRLLLHREPESEDIYKEHVGRRDPGVLVRDTWNSDDRQTLWKNIIGCQSNSQASTTDSPNLTRGSAGNPLECRRES